MEDVVIVDPGQMDTGKIDVRLGVTCWWDDVGAGCSKNEKIERKWWMYRISCVWVGMTVV